jgi:nitrite reductase/ring-hydroxylating ferredoxin subunit
MRRVVRSGTRSVLVLRHLGQVYACESSCPHMGFPLEWAQVTADCGIICALHHSAFDLRTGDVKAWSPWPPGIGPLFKGFSRDRYLKVFPTRVDEGGIWVDVEE